MTIGTPSKTSGPGPRRRASNGFTLIESLTVVAVIAISLALAMPTLTSFLVKNKVSALSNEFTAALMQARSLAVTKNACVTMCASSNASVCNSTASVSDFQNGWIMFRNANCDATQTAPTTSATDMLGIRQGENNGYTIKPAAATLGSMMFDPRGTAALSAQGLFQVLPPNPSSSPTNLKRNICIDVTGRSWVRQYDPTSCS